MTKAEPAPEPAPDGRNDRNARNEAPHEDYVRSGRRPRRERGKLHRRLHAHPVLSVTTKVVVTTIGLVVLVGGVVMIFIPGPGILGIIVGLAILATEYDRAHDLLLKARQKAHEAKEKAENMDPRVRRRRLALTALVVVVVLAAVAAYVTFYDWPGFAVVGWNWLQDLAGWVPELPGM